MDFSRLRCGDAMRFHLQVDPAAYELEIGLAGSPWFFFYWPADLCGGVACQATRATRGFYDHATVKRSKR